jgi:transcription elongation factor GreA
VTTFHDLRAPHPPGARNAEPRTTAVAEDRLSLTRDGLTRLREELDYLKNVRRPEVADALEQARESNLSTEDDPGYELAKEEQAKVEDRIVYIEDILSRADVIDEAAAHQSDTVRLGSTVIVKPEDGPEQTYQIVGSPEVDIARGKISDSSPVGRALIGRRAGDNVEVAVPNGQRRLRIVSLT